MNEWNRLKNLKDDELEKSERLKIQSSVAAIVQEL